MELLQEDEYTVRWRIPAPQNPGVRLHGARMDRRDGIVRIGTSGSQVFAPRRSALTIQGYNVR